MPGATGPGLTALTEVGQILGTPYYMSPEQWGMLPEGRVGEIDGRADIYSMGVIFYELITGNKPFKGSSFQELGSAHMMVVPPLLHEVVPDVPEAFSRVIARAMAKDRDERPATFGEFVNELRTTLHFESVIKSNSGQLTSERLTTSERQLTSETTSKGLIN